MGSNCQSSQEQQSFITDGFCFLQQVHEDNNSLLGAQEDLLKFVNIQLNAQNETCPMRCPQIKDTLISCNRYTTHVRDRWLLHPKAARHSAGDPGSTLSSGTAEVRMRYGFAMPAVEA